MSAATDISSGLEDGTQAPSLTAVSWGDTMGFKDYIAVLDSDVYEYCGTTKSILARIAHLIIEPPKEDDVTGKQIGEPKANVGFCVASQDYIACQLGLSVSKVWKATKLFKKDGWLDIVKTRDRYGDHNKYQWAEGAWDRLAARKREETEQGEYVRTKQVLMERWPKQGRFARDKDAGNQRVGEGIEATHPFEDTPLREERSPHYADSVEATTPIALSALRYQRVKQVGVDVYFSESSKACEKNPTGHDGDSHTPCGVSQSPTQEQPRGLKLGEDFSPSPATLPHPGRDIPVSSPTARPPVPPPPATPKVKPICRFLNCGGPLKGNKPNGECLKCGHKPAAKVEVAKPRRVDPNARHRWPPRAQITPETICLNPGCGGEFEESKYDRSPCDGEGARIAEEWRA